MTITQQFQLPPHFEKLEDYSSWVLEDEVARRLKCAASSMEEIQAFYDSMLTSMDEILAHLNQYSLNDLAEPEKNLLSLALGFVEAAISVEMFEQPELVYGMSIERFCPLHHLVP